MLGRRRLQTSGTRARIQIDHAVLIVVDRLQLQLRVRMLVRMMVVVYVVGVVHAHDIQILGGGRRHRRRIVDPGDVLVLLGVRVQERLALVLGVVVGRHIVVRLAGLLLLVARGREPLPRERVDEERRVLLQLRRLLPLQRALLRDHA